MAKEMLEAESDPWLVSSHDITAASGTDYERGLSAADAADRLLESGPNILAPADRKPQWRKLLSQFADPLVYLLVGAILVSVAAWVVEGAVGTPIEAIVIAAIVALNGLLGYVQERSAENSVAALQGMSAATATVVRDGRSVPVPAADVVTGDILVLAEGDAVAADARLLEARSLFIAEASLTGESEPVLKDTAALSGSVPLAERVNMVFSGTAVTRGRGLAVVTGTGMRSETGRVSTLLSDTERERTPLQRQIDGVSKLLVRAVIVIAVVVIGAILLTSEISGPGDLVDVLLVGVSLAVAAVPEGLQTILTVILALGVQRMVKQRALVKRLSSVETLGSTSVICSDKTGTLTKNEMTVERIATHSGTVMVTGAGIRPEGEVTLDGAALTGHVRGEVTVVLGGGSLANDASLNDDDGTWTAQGDPTEVAFLVAERKLGTAERRIARFTRVGEVPFTSERKLMSTIEADADHGPDAVVVTKGAPDVLLGRCTHERVGSQTEELTEARRAEILATVDRLANDALRTLAVAYRVSDRAARPPSDESLEYDLIFVGVVGMIDPPRPEATVAIAEALAAGVRIVMITGDHPRTASRIAADLGITAASHTGSAVTGAEIDALDDTAFAELARSASVYARVAPEHKLRLVDALQANGDVVAMTGDGVNDAPALKSADIGVAMGITGTDVSKEAATMILVDDNFATIVAAVREGRSIYANIRKFLRYLLSSNIGEVLTMVIGIVAASVIGLDAGPGLAVPLLATQILWINLLTDSLPALALGVDPAGGDVMRDKPRRASDPLVDREMWLGVMYVGLVMAIATLLTIDFKLPGGLIEGSANLEQARTAGFTVLVLAQLFNCFNSRSERASAFLGLLSNRWLWGAVAVSLILQVAVVYVPFLNDAFDTTALTLTDWAICVAAASSVLWLDELKKVIVRMTVRRRS